MQSQPLVSVLMTAYNREKYIGEAIESVQASNYTNWELIITDDGSKDNTAAIARAYAEKDPRVKVFVNEKNLGDYLNRNQAAMHASGKYIKYLDADDMFYYFGLEVMVRFMEQFPEADFGMMAHPEDERPYPVMISPREIYLENFNNFGHFDRAPGSSIIKLDAFRRLGGFSGQRMIGDYEFWFKIARYCKMVKFPFDLYWNRLHTEQESKSGYARLYPQLRKKVLEEALAHPDCPLNESELVAVKKKIKSQETKNRILGAMGKIRRLVK